MSNTASLSSADMLVKLNKERDTLRAFLVLLEHEQQALIASDTEALLPLSEKKTQSADELLTLVKKHREALPDSLTTEQWLQEHAPEGLPVWREILLLAERLQQQNHLNGELIQIKMRYNQQALVALVGATQHVAGLYGPNGQTNLPSTGRTLGSG